MSNALIDKINERFVDKSITLLINIYFSLPVMLILISGISKVSASPVYDFSGFGSVGLAKIDDDSITETNSIVENYRPTKWSANYDSRLGVQGSVYFNERFSLTTQIVSLGIEDYKPKFEWAYASYRFTDALNMRLGILRRPFYANSDILHVGYAYDWIRPPTDVYSVDVRYFDDVEGIAFDYTFQLNEWDLLGEFYYGQGSGDITSISDQKLNYQIDNGYGVILTVERDWFSSRTSFHESNEASIDDANEFIPLFNVLDSNGFQSISNNMSVYSFPIRIYTASMELSPATWLLNAEYLYVPDVDNVLPEEKSWYIMGGKRIGSYRIHMTYSKRDRYNKEVFSQPILDQIAFLKSNPSIENLTAAGELEVLAATIESAQEKYFSSDQHSYTIGARYDFKQPISLKMEYQRMIDKENNLENNLISAVVDFLF